MLASGSAERCVAQKLTPPVANIANALTESFNGLYKAELIFHEGPWSGHEVVEWATLTYVDWFNNRRLHGEIGMVPPAELEEFYYRQTEPTELVASQISEPL